MRRRPPLVLIALALASSALGAPDPTHPGRFPVGVTTADAVDGSRGDRTLPTEIWYPARRTGRDVAPLPRRFPLVLIAHGFCGSRLYYDYLATHLASWGFVIAAPDFTGVTRAACDARQSRPPSTTWRSISRSSVACCTTAPVRSGSGPGTCEARGRRSSGTPSEAPRPSR